MSNIQKSNSQIAKKNSENALDRFKKFKKNVGESLNDGQRMFYQYIVFVIDASRSMRSETENGISKAEEVDKAIKSVLNRLKRSKHTSSFDIGMWCFSDDFTCIFSNKGVRELDGHDFNPLNLINEPGATYLNSALLDVEKEIDNYCKQNFTKNHQVLMLLLTDGAINDRIESLKTITRIKEKQNVSVSAMYLGRFIYENDKYYSWNEKTDQIDYNSPVDIKDVIEGDRLRGERLKEFATSEAFFINNMNPEEIRKHMIKSVSTTTSFQLGKKDKALELE